MPSSLEFSQAIQDLLEKAQSKNLPFIEVRSGDIHTQLGGYPGPNHQMPTCCQVMYRSMQTGDEIIKKPAKGKGANLIIRYKFPRKINSDQIPEKKL